MKKLILGLMAFALVTTAVQAQQNAKKVIRSAEKALSAFRMDNANKDKIAEAVQVVEELMAMDIPQDEKADAYLAAGDVYNEIATQINTAKSLNLNTAEELPQVEYPAVKAFENYKMALENAEKKYQTKSALKGLQEVQNYLSFRGIEYFQNSDFDGAMKSFQAMLSSHDVLKENGEESAIDAEENLMNQYYLYGLASFNAGKIPTAKLALMKLYDADAGEPAVYEYLYKIESIESDAETAYKYLEEGRKKYPEELGLLFAEINHFLKLGQSEVLVDKIKQAIKAEPNNISLYNVLGSTYDQLSQASAEAGDAAKADEYRNNAIQQFKKALEIDPSNVIAVYSIGQIFYNRAALKTQQMQEYASDYSKEGMKKYEELRDQVFAEFDKALPFFQISESMDPNDVNTLIALKEIYAKKDNIEMSNVFKERLDTVQAGGKNDSSHFKSSDVNLEVELSKL